ncbi:hypothetical protein CONCODRAFT_71942 [Conidiobolus coronatus NRRL 28638]|uniref:Uncharacterized protein n=1 Tax=Conidiobolus coronatus (strain ATCC 28846 / CBS 209.66 / NRRL 28638) TaxID=796925 RepID=A0A137P1T6_CONC2|nr:hypothetical protein CONCODRAFT_71942 [Conidiobolus coronatus NRRL 28638]|eukprot:KXN68841.1 hypothetical protein CONCODRAFT_71942 [Conidiobolus coronatus NRRL 28638]
MSGKGSFSSNKTLISTLPPDYESEKYSIIMEEKASPNNEEYHSESKLGLILFLIGFIFPLSWIVGVIMCFSRGVHRSKTWGIANSIATVFLLLGLAGFVAYIIIRGSPAGSNGYDDVSNIFVPTPTPSRG